MQAADRGMRVPGAVGAVFFEDPGQAVGIFGEVFEADRAVFEKRDRLPVALHRHHDVEARRAHLPDRLLEGRVGRLDDGAGETEIAHQFDQAPSAAAGFPAGRRRRIRSTAAPPARLAQSARPPGGTSGCRATNRSSCDRPARPRWGRARRCAGSRPSRRRRSGNGRCRAPGAPGSAAIRARSR